MHEKYKRIRTAEAVYLIRHTRLSQLSSELGYDWDTKFILKSGEKMNLVLEWDKFTTALKVELPRQDFKEACYVIAIQNNPEPKTREDVVSEYVLNWIGQRTKVYTLDIFSKDCLRLDAADPRRRSWEIKLARILKAKGWYKGRDSKGRYWERKILNSHPTETKHELDDIL